MENGILGSVFSDTVSVSISITGFLISIVAAIIIGIFMAKMYMWKSKCTKGFASTLALLPLAVSMVIMMVNGNVGTGVAVAGAFSLVRFRSVPGTAKEIAAVFVAMGIGLTVGMGYIAFAIIFAVIACGFTLILNMLNFGEQKDDVRTMHITIPESLNYTDVFDDLFEKYTNKVALIATKTTNMGSLFKLSYEIELKDTYKEKEFIDEIRCRNGNLDIVITKQDLLNVGL